MAAEKVFLHGDLELTILGIRVSHRYRVMRFFVDKRLKITVNVGGARVAQTRAKSCLKNSAWNEHCIIPLAHLDSEVCFQVIENRDFPRLLRCIGHSIPLADGVCGTVCGAQRIIGTTYVTVGTGTVQAKDILPNATGESIFNGWVPVNSSSLTTCPTDIQVRMKFTPCPEKYSRGVEGLRESYYPLRRGGKVTLYQDAHVTDKMLLGDESDNNIQREHGKCWEDIYRAILGAQHLVYIVGWSINLHIKLVIKPTTELPFSDMNLGELLKHKSESGVKVLILLWADLTRSMGTRCSETLKFFKGSSVYCLLIPRVSRYVVDLVELVEDLLYTHHQKCVIVDTQKDENSRKIIAFIGGLDLCAGRFDTPEHQLFPETNNAFQDYSHNPNFNNRVRCPRQPWHDLHCRIEGPAAYDVLKNFEQRWRRFSMPLPSVVRLLKSFTPKLEQKLQRFRHWSRRFRAYDAFLKIEDVPNVIHSPGFSQQEEDDSENWHVQIFRSIDSDSVDNFPKDVHEVDKQNLIIGKRSKVVDRSIQMAYIKGIRSAEHYIYIENQYFIGSSYAWPSDSGKGVGANNLIPMELTQKIISKIRAKERFAVYVVIPMWPEGDPNSSAVQEILYWQRQTMEMMYTSIADVLKSAQVEGAHPTDYLNFYCLGNRVIPPEETVANGDHSSNGRSLPSVTCIRADDCVESASHKYGRFMIYVHSKGMIVDDEYVILGSANINQRSMDGSRDTEIAMGAYQPYYTWAKKDHPHGQVYRYRMSLWEEHFGMIDKDFEEPETVACMNKVNGVAEDNWKRYAGEEFTSLQGHILKYPIKVEADGKISSLQTHETFPDVGGMILGARSTLPKRFPCRVTT